MYELSGRYDVRIDSLRSLCDLILYDARGYRNNRGRRIDLAVYGMFVDLYERLQRKGLYAHCSSACRSRGLQLRS